MAWKRIQSLMEPSALFCQGNVLLHRGRCPKELAHLIEGEARARCRGHTSESAHGVVALFDTTMILLESIVERAVGPVEHITTKGLADRTRVGVMPIGRHPLWGVTNHIDSLRRSKRLAASISRFSIEPRINQIAISIDGSIEIASFPFDGDGGFNHVPGPPYLATSLSSQLIRHERIKTGFPVSNGLMGELKAALHEHLGQVPRAQCVPEPPEDDQEHDVRGVFQKVERDFSTLIEGSLAVGAAEYSRAERGTFALFFGHSRPSPSFPYTDRHGPQTRKASSRAHSPMLQEAPAG